MRAILTALVLLLAMPALAAKRDAPNKNVDKSNDAETEKLNQGQATQK